MMNTSNQKSIVIAVLLVFVGVLYFGTGCSAFEKVSADGVSREIDKCKVLGVAKAADAVADAASAMVCMFLVGEAQERCLKNRAMASAAAKVGIGSAQSMMKSCGIGD